MHTHRTHGACALHQRAAEPERRRGRGSGRKTFGRRRLGQLGMLLSMSLPRHLASTASSERFGRHCSMRAEARQSGHVEVPLPSACRRQSLQNVCWQHGSITGTLSSSRQIGQDSARSSSSICLELVNVATASSLLLVCGGEGGGEGGGGEGAGGTLGRGGSGIPDAAGTRQQRAPQARTSPSGQDLVVRGITRVNAREIKARSKLVELAPDVTTGSAAPANVEHRPRWVRVSALFVRRVPRGMWRKGALKGA